MIDYLKHKKADLVIPLLMLGFATYYYLEVRSLPKPGTNLLLIGPTYWIIVAAVSSYVITSYFKFANLNKTKRAAEDGLEVTDIKAAFIFIGFTCAYIFSIEWLGFVTSSFIYILLFLLVFSIPKKLVLILLPTLTVLFIYIILDVWLNIPLPKGWLI